MPREIRHQKRARNDLRQIWHYTEGEWGREQADRYLRDIGQKIAMLLDYPEIGPIVPGRKRNYRKLVVREHIVLYRIDRQIVRIIRVRHHSTDWQALIA